MSTYGQVEDYTVDMIGIITGVNEMTAGAWSVYPNPSNGDFEVRYAGRDGLATIEVLDMILQPVRSALGAPLVWKAMAVPDVASASTQ